MFSSMYCIIWFHSENFVKYLLLKKKNYIFSLNNFIKQKNICIRLKEVQIASRKVALLPSRASIDTFLKYCSRGQGLSPHNLDMVEDKQELTPCKILSLVKTLFHVSVLYTEKI